jgi:hypothetical protein
VHGDVVDVLVGNRQIHEPVTIEIAKQRLFIAAQSFKPGLRGTEAVRPYHGHIATSRRAVAHHDVGEAVAVHVSRHQWTLFADGDAPHPRHPLG